MRKHPVRRLAAAIINLLFLLAWGEPVSLHPCPMHDGVAVHASATGASASASAMHHGHAMAQAMAPADAPAHAGHPAGHVCSCLGSCSVSVGVVAPTAQAIRWQVIVSRREAPDHEDPAAPRAAADRLLPFANGPPRSA